MVRIYRLFLSFFYSVYRVMRKLYRRFFVSSSESVKYSDIARTQDKLLAALKPVSSNPTFLIVLYPSAHSHEGLLATIQSLYSQAYSNWKIVINEPSVNYFSNAEVWLDSINTDARIKLNLYSNRMSVGSCIHSITCDYVLPMFVLGVFHKECLNAIARYIEDEPKAKVIYTDEDFYNEHYVRVRPHFKPKWNPDLFFSTNYVSNVCVFDKKMLVDINFFPHTNYSLVLKSLGLCLSDEVIHVPFVLFHNLFSASEEASSFNSVLHRSELAALKTYFKEDAVGVSDGLLPNTYKVSWPIPDNQPLVSIIIPTRNAVNLVRQCIESLYLKTRYNNFEVLLVDNQSDDKESLKYFEELNLSGKVRLIRYNKVFNYSAINNFAVEHAAGEILVFMNNDIELISENWLNEMVSQTIREEIGCVGAMLYYQNNTIQHAGVVLGLGRCAGHSHKYYSRYDNGYMNRLKVVQNYSAVTAACLGVTKNIFEEVGGFNAEYLPVAFNDVDFCIKVFNAGYRNLWTPYAEMYHHESVSRGVDDTPEKQQRAQKEIQYMQRTWHLDRIVDPSYSRWLTIGREDFTI
ncbi:glycosyltransferase family 2 protein [Agarivorans aestuarii]|uniref:Glycosyltransferase family 2 protein n=1 Tax=Agarivorans aestuarii TaxID=1563703 RepID=A0ABU7G077_9ALTE|nr:glycosyltransferase family 2 protein [Agarivorans aestuarii]MEE1672816.1 glycosyltransferase family 2 protein [Agarivorans aestuarii]